MPNASRDDNFVPALIGHSDTTANSYTRKVLVDENGNLNVALGDSAHIDAFGRMRASNPETLFATQTQYNAAPMQMEAGATGTGTTAYNTNTRMVGLTCSSGTGVAYLQSYQYSPYEPGKSQVIAVTGVMGTAVANAVKDIGYFDANNGIFYRQNGTNGLQLVRRTSTSGSVVDNAVNQANWNIDTFDGSNNANNPSGIKLDATKAFILYIDLQFLGMGRVRVGFDIDGTVYYAHEFLCANNLTVPYMQQATLPIQALVTASATGTSATLNFKCATVQSEGGFLPNLGFSFSTPEGTATAGSGARTHILSVRPKTTFNGITNRELFIANGLDILVTGNNPIYWELVTGATFSAGPTWADVNTTYSAYEYGVTGTYQSTSAVTVLASGYVAATNTQKTSISENLTLRTPIALNRAGAVTDQGTLTLLVTGIGAGSATRASLNYLEIR